MFWADFHMLIYLFPFLKDYSFLTVNSGWQGMVLLFILCKTVYCYKVIYNKQYLGENHMLIQPRHDADKAPWSPQMLWKVNPSNDPGARATYCPSGRAPWHPVTCHKGQWTRSERWSSVRAWSCTWRLEVVHSPKALRGQNQSVLTRKASFHQFWRQGLTDHAFHPRGN